MSSSATPANENAKMETFTSRRRLLRFMALSAAGVAATVVAAGSLTRAAPFALNLIQNGASASGASTTNPKSQASVKVKAVYFQMSQSIPVEQEYFVLQSPAVLQDLMNNVAALHPVVSSMFPKMGMFIDGVPAKPAAPLRDGDEVDFIPVYAGG